jgi:hypothetical protein
MQAGMSTHRTQREDIANFPQFKQAFLRNKTTRLLSSLSKKKVQLTVADDWMQCFKPAWDAAFSQATNLRGWSLSGVQPFNCRPLWQARAEQSKKRTSIKAFASSTTVNVSPLASPPHAATATQMLTPTPSAPAAASPQAGQSAVVISPCEVIAAILLGKMRNASVPTSISAQLDDEQTDDQNDGDEGDEEGESVDEGADEGAAADTTKPTSNIDKPPTVRSLTQLQWAEGPLTQHEMLTKLKSLQDEKRDKLEAKKRRQEQSAEKSAKKARKVVADSDEAIEILANKEKDLQALSKDHLLALLRIAGDPMKTASKKADVLARCQQSEKLSAYLRRKEQMRVDE